MVTGFLQQNLLMFISNGATVKFKNCTIWGNSVNRKAFQYGGIFKIRDWGEDVKQATVLVFKGCTIHNNNAYNVLLSYRRS